VQLIPSECIGNAFPRQFRHKAAINQCINAINQSIRIAQIHEKMNCPSVIADMRARRSVSHYSRNLGGPKISHSSIAKSETRVSNGPRIESETSIRSNVHVSALLQRRCYCDSSRARWSHRAGEFASPPLFLFSSSSSSSWRYERRRVEIGSKGGSRRDGTRLESLSTLFYFCSASTLAAGHGAVYKWFK